jgi:hypothetical protein
MNQEEIIRDEAKNFVIDNLHSHVEGTYYNGYKTFMADLKNELTNLYLPDKKMIYLDEIKRQVISVKDKHNSNCPTFQSGNTCATEKDYLKVEFYVQQEIDELPSILKPNEITDKKHKRTKVFVSYSHADKIWLDKLKRHFKPFKDKIDFWEDSQIKPGQEWLKEIETAMNQTKVAIFLVSADFFASDFITNKEVPKLLETAKSEGALILSVILRPCAFDLFPDLNRYQAANNPSNPVSAMSENDAETLWASLVRQVMQMVE